MTKTKIASVIALFLCCMAALLLWQQKTIRDLKSDNARWRERSASLESVRDENARLLQAQTNWAEVERLRKDHSELLRLRGEVSRLRQQLKAEQLASAKRTAPTKHTPPSTVPGEEAVTPVETFTANARANVAPSETLVTGGWTMPSGKRALFFIQPEFISATGEIISAAGEGAQVMLQTRVAELPASVLTQLGLDGLKADNRQSSSQAILTAAQSETVLKALQSSAGVDLLSAPKTLTLDGRQAQVKVGQVTTISGEVFELGPSVDIVPRISADGAAVELTVSAQLRLQTTPPR